jgi:hypothetical protein
MVSKATALCSQPDARRMDVSNPSHFFASQVPFLARGDRFVRYAACAVGAKHLGQMKTPEDRIGCSAWQRQFAEKLTSGSKDFLWYMKVVLRRVAQY